MTMLAAPVLLSQSDKTRTAVLVAAVYAILNLLSSLASRKSHRAVQWAGDERRLSGRIWLVALIAYLQRLGTDLNRPVETESETVEPVASVSAEH